MGEARHYRPCQEFINGAALAAIRLIRSTNSSRQGGSIASRNSTAGEKKSSRVFSVPRIQGGSESLKMKGKRTVGRIPGEDEDKLCPEGNVAGKFG